MTAEFSSNKLDSKSLKAGAALQHPLTQSTQQYVVGDRFHTSANPHKSQLCEFHNINLCLQRDTIKTSYQECQNNSKNLKRLRSATMQSFPVHFVYNFLMDFYHNEEIVDRQRKRLSLSLKGGQELRRDEHHRFIVVNNNWLCLEQFMYDNLCAYIWHTKDGICFSNEGQQFHFYPLLLNVLCWHE